MVVIDDWTLLMWIAAGLAGLWVVATLVARVRKWRLDRKIRKYRDAVKMHDLIRERR